MEDEKKSDNSSGERGRTLTQTSNYERMQTHTLRNDETSTGIETQVRDATGVMVDAS